MTLPFHYTSYIWPTLAPTAFTVALLVIPLLLHLLSVFSNDAHHWLWLGFSFLIPVACEQVYARAGGDILIMGPVSCSQGWRR